MIKAYRNLLLIGIFIWTATHFFRGTSLMDYEVVKQILWRTPNFAAVWVGVGLTYITFPLISKKEFDPKHTYLLVGVIMVLLIILEIVHHIFLESPFDIWDIVASVIASLFIIVIHTTKKYNE